MDSMDSLPSGLLPKEDEGAMAEAGAGAVLQPDIVRFTYLLNNTCKDDFVLCFMSPVD